MGWSSAEVQAFIVAQSPFQHPTDPSGSPTTTVVEPSDAVYVARAVTGPSTPLRGRSIVRVTTPVPADLTIRLRSGPTEMSSAGPGLPDSIASSAPPVGREDGRTVRRAHASGFQTRTVRSSEPDTRIWTPSGPGTTARPVTSLV